MALAASDVASARPSGPSDVTLWLPLRAAAEMVLWAAIVLIWAGATYSTDGLLPSLFDLRANWLLVLGPSLMLWHRLPTLWRKPFATAVGIGFLILRTPHALVVMAFSLMVYFLPSLWIPGRLRAAIFVVMLVLFSWVAALFLTRDMMLLPIWMMVLHRYIVKLVYWYYERSLLMKQSPPLIDYLFYFFGIPFALDFSNCSFLYLQRQQCDPVPPDLMVRGLRHMRNWWLALMGWGFAHWQFPDLFKTMVGVAEDPNILFQLPRGEGIALVVLSFAFLYITFAVGKEWNIGALRLFGYDAHNAFDKPLLSASPAQFWRRYHVYLYEFVRSVFFFPVATFLVRRFPRQHGLCVFIAVLAAFAGIGCLDLLPAVFCLNRAPGAMLSFARTTFNFVFSFGVLVAVSVVLEGWWERQAFRVPRAIAWAVRWGIGVPFTLLTVSLIRIVFRDTRGMIEPNNMSTVDAIRLFWHLVGF